MKILRYASGEGLARQRPVATLGNFDGVHRGHQEIIRRAVKHATDAGVPAVAVTFHPHPVSVVRSRRAPLMMNTLRQRIRLLATHGIDIVALLHFTPTFAAVGASAFVREYLAKRLAIQHLVVGRNVGFGRGRTGNAELLCELGRELGFAVDVVVPVLVDGVRVSSSRVRKAIGDGELGAAARMLGRPYAVEGRVVHGHHRGHGLGFPTANLRLAGRQLPPDGVYAVRVLIREERYRGVANLGFNPTFSDRERSLETHLFDFAGDLYGRRISVTFVRRLRGERRFPNPRVLARQIEQDAAQARQVLAVE